MRRGLPIRSEQPRHPQRSQISKDLLRFLSSSGFPPNLSRTPLLTSLQGVKHPYVLCPAPHPQQQMVRRPHPPDHLQFPVMSDSRLAPLQQPQYPLAPVSLLLSSRQWHLLLDQVQTPHSLQFRSQTPSATLSTLQPARLAPFSLHKPFLQFLRFHQVLIHWAHFPCFSHQEYPQLEGLPSASNL